MSKEYWTSRMACTPARSDPNATYERSAAAVTPLYAGRLAEGGDAVEAGRFPVATNADERLRPRADLRAAVIGELVPLGPGVDLEARAIARAQVGGVGAERQPVQR